jgi:hypothetical protein
VSFNLNQRFTVEYSDTLLVNSGGISKAQLRALPEKLRTIADLIDKLNATALSPANDIKWAPYARERQIAREHMIRRYQTLPGLLRVYSWHLERFREFARRTAKRLTGGHLMAIELVRHVENRTGSPHYREVSELLEQGWTNRRTSRKSPQVSQG